MSCHASSPREAIIMMNVRESKSAATIRRKRPQLGPSNAVLHRHKVLDDQFDPSAEDPEYYSLEEVDVGHSLLRLMLTNDWILFLGLLSFRTINALMIQTSYVPDEYWQSVEVAHNMAYGYVLVHRVEQMLSTIFIVVFVGGFCDLLPGISTRY